MKLQIIACDRCGLREDKGAISPWTARRGNVRYTGDLCQPCWDDLLATFKPSNLPKGRHKMQATRIEDIPTE